MRKVITGYVYYVSAKKEKEEKNTRLFQKDGNKNREESFGEEKREGPQEAYGLGCSG